MSTTTTPLTFTKLLAACKAGGGSALSVTTPLAPAGGPGALIAPARVTDRNGPAYAFERRLEFDPELNEFVAKWTVLIKSKQGVSNADEAAVLSARLDQDSPIGLALLRVPTILVTYDGMKVSDLELPHRAFDAHIRAGSVGGTPITATDEYRALRNANPGNARALIEAAPTSLLYGAWDSTRKSHQARYTTAITGEIVGVVADQDNDPNNSTNRRHGARVDPVAASIRLDEKTVKALVEDQKDDLSPKLQEKILGEAKKGGAKGSSMSTLGFGHIPPSLEGLGGVACSSITRRRVLSFAALRQLRFGGNAEADAACRALLAAYGLLAMTLSDQELYIRANCELVEAGPSTMTLDLRQGRSEELEPLDEDSALALFTEALTHAREVAGIDWSGQVLEVLGNQSILSAASADEADE
ncbi:MAG: type I-U CRISPR-associated RAMP protein Csb1/Cas7u [Dermabacter sp.]|nr:type I-U CRISPR-associated RAMP protein Csb1/Cas7u [Dermabacter sp.]